MGDPAHDGHQLRHGIQRKRSVYQSMLHWADACLTSVKSMFKKHDMGLPSANLKPTSAIT